MSHIERVPFDIMCHEFTRILLALNVEKSKAHRCAQIFAENTRDGVISHGLNRFPLIVEHIKTGVVDIKVEPECINALGALEQWDGKRGFGPLNAERAMQRAIEIAEQTGMGCVGLRNTNHWMRAGTYGLQAAEAGCIGICWTNTIGLMPPWGASQKKIGNNPLVVCIPRQEGPVLLDIAMSQFSNGKLEVTSRRGEELPLVGGYDKKGKLTKNPQAILDSSRALPIGYWKGSGLALALDLMATLIANGDSTMDISERGVDTGMTQVFLAIPIVKQMGLTHVEDTLNTILEDFLAAATDPQSGKIHYPGQGMLAARKENLEKGIPVDTQLWQEVLKMELPE